VDEEREFLHGEYVGGSHDRGRTGVGFAGSGRMRSKRSDRRS